MYWSQVHIPAMLADLMVGLLGDVRGDDMCHDGVTSEAVHGGLVLSW